METTKMLKRIVDLSYKFKGSHIGSCITALPLIAQIYEMKESDDPFILSSGHAALALYVVMEEYEGYNAESLFKKHGTHPNLDTGIWCSTGSLGHGLGIGLGMALADKKRTVYVLISDGESNEGSIWEAIRIAADRKVGNLIILVNANGYSAYDDMDQNRLEWRIGSFINEGFPKISFNRTSCILPHLRGLAGHYATLDEKMYKDVMEEIEKL